MKQSVIKGVIKETSNVYFSSKQRHGSKKITSRYCKQESPYLSLSDWYHLSTSVIMRCRQTKHLYSVPSVEPLVPRSHCNTAHYTL